MPTLSNMRILILAADGFETVELFEPRDKLRALGAEVVVASPKREPIQGMKGDIEPAEKLDPDLSLDEVDTSDFDALVLPGGTCNPDKLRRETRALEIVREFDEDAKPIAAICHAPWLLVEAGVVAGRQVTSFESIRTDLANAGADVVNEPVVIDRHLITSRCPDDLPAFIDAITAALAELEATQVD